MIRRHTVSALPGQGTAKRRLHVWLSVVVKIKPGEEIPAVLLFAYFFLITAPFGIVKSIRDASYLDDLQAKNLPYAYLSAIVVGLAVSLHAKLQARISRRLLLLATLAFFILTGLGFWGLFAVSDWPWLSLVYWTWANLFIVALTTQFWFLVNDIFNPREAKRLIGFFGSGGLLGGIAGYLLTWLLAPSKESERLLLLSTVFLVACLAVVNGVFSWMKKSRIRPAAPSLESSPLSRAGHVGLGDSFQSVRRDAYLKLLAAVVVVTGIVSTFIDWQSKSIIERNPVARANFASFFGRLNAGMLVFAFLLQLVLTSRFLDRFGIRAGLLIYPSVLLLGIGGIAVWPTLAFAVGLKGGDKAMSYTINQSARELLYIPVSPELKYRAKVFIDMFLNRLSKAAGGLILLVLIFAAGRKPLSSTGVAPFVLVSVVAGALILAWMILNVRIGGAYVREVKDKLAKKWERADRMVAEKVDLEGASLIVDALESRSESPTLFALHVYELARQNKLTPEIKEALGLSQSEFSPSVGNPLMEGDEAPWVPDFNDEGIAAGVDKEIQEILALGDYQKLMEGYADRVLEGKSPDSETAKMELANAIGLMNGQSPLAGKLEDLLLDESPMVFHEAVHSAGRLRRKEFVPLLMAKLSDPKMSADVHTALAKYGGSIIGELSDYLSAPDETLEVRCHAAGLLAETATQDAADILLEELARSDGPLKESLIDALDQVRLTRDEIVFTQDAVADAIRRDLAKLRAARSPSDLLPAFKLLGLVYDHEDVFRAYQNFLAGTKDLIAYAVELLDYILDPELKGLVIPILESFSGGRA